VAVWKIYNETNESHEIQGSIFSDISKTWTTPVAISDSVNTNASTPVLAVSSTGNAVVLWYAEDLNTFNSVIQASMFDSGSWTSPTDLSLNDGTEIPTFDIDVKISTVDAMVGTWTAYVNGNLTIRSAYASIGGSWSAPLDVAN